MKIQVLFECLLTE